jgi:hypothetical protein
MSNSPIIITSTLRPGVDNIDLSFEQKSLLLNVFIADTIELKTASKIFFHNFDRICVPMYCMALKVIKNYCYKFVYARMTLFKINHKIGWVQL